MTRPDAAGLLRHGVLLEWYRYPPGPPVVLPRHAHEEYQFSTVDQLVSSADGYT